MKISVWDLVRKIIKSDIMFYLKNSFKIKKKNEPKSEKMK